MSNNLEEIENRYIYNITKFIDDIAVVRNTVKYNYTTDDINEVVNDEKINKYKKLLRYCAVTVTLVDDVDTYKVRYNGDNGISCFARPSNKSNSDLAELSYKFKRAYNDTATDLFMTEILGPDLFSNYTRYIYYTLNYYISMYIYEYNKITANVNKLTENDILIMQLGGNIMRCYINMFLDMINENSPNKTEQETNILQELIVMQKKSDWDYNIYINPDLPSNVYDKIKSDILIILTYALSKVKNKLDTEYFLNKRILDMGNMVQNKFFKTAEVKELIDKYSKNINTDIKLEEIKTPYQIIREDSIENIENDVNKKSYVVGRDESAKVRDYTQVNEFYGDNVIEGYPIYGKFEDSPIFVGYSKRISIYAQYVRHDFSLLRLKVNNKFVVKISNSNEKKSIDVPYEIIDIGVKSTKDNKYNIIKDMMQNKNLMNTIKLRTMYKDKNVLSEMKIPSIHFYIADVELIILHESLFVWVDKKYKKRVTRAILLNMSAAALFNSKSKQYIADVINDVLLLMQNLKNLDIRNKVDYIHQNINYSILKKDKNIDDEIVIANSKFDFLVTIVKNYIKMVLVLAHVTKVPLQNYETNFVNKVLLPNKTIKNISKDLNLATTLDYESDVVNKINDHIQELGVYETNLIEILTKLGTAIQVSINNNIKFGSLNKKYDKYI